MQNATTTSAITSPLAAATDLVKAYLAQNPGRMTPDETLRFLKQVHNSLAAIATGAPVPAAEAEPEEAEEAQPLVPAVPVKDSVTEDYIVCLEDGTKHKMMKRYLRRVFNMTPDEYRARWGLPKDYPMTAPGYSAQKREEARAVGLGTAANKQGVNVGRELAVA